MLQQQNVYSVRAQSYALQAIPTGNEWIQVILNKTVKNASLLLN
jgi:hypothetical protein